MRPFHRVKDESRPIDGSKRNNRQHTVNMTGHDYSDMRQDTATIKVWLPESVEKQLDEITSYLNTSLSDFIRQILFQHLYGRYDLIGLVERDKYESKIDFDMPLYSLKNHNGNEPPPPPPKKVAGIKVYVPERMRKDLDALAAAKHQTISEYVRQVIYQHLFGVMQTAGIQTSLPVNADDVD